jgi:hypothetical protein
MSFWSRLQKEPLEMLRRLSYLRQSEARDIAGAKGAGLSPAHPGQNEARVPFSEAEQLVAAVEKN